MDIGVDRLGLVCFFCSRSLSSFATDNYMINVARRRHLVVDLCA